MTRLDMDEQEQIANIKAFFMDYGRYIFYFILVISILFLVKSYWQHYKQQTYAKQLALYKKIDFNKLDSAIKIMRQLNIRYPESEYTSFANLQMAKKLFDAGKSNLVSQYLSFVIQNSANDKLLIILAKQRLIDVYLDNKQFVKARLLIKELKPYKSIYYNKLGDLELLSGNMQKAISSYKESVSVSPSSLVQLKSSLLSL